MKLKNLLEGTGAKTDRRLAETDITSVCPNSKDVRKGSLFVAIEGFKLDGHEFLKEATERGAAALIVNSRKELPSGIGNIIGVDDTRKALSTVARNYYGAPSEKIKVVGITGTNGKTTTSLLIQGMFNESRIPCGVIGTIEYRVGNRVIGASRTTPDALSINSFLDDMIKNGLRAAVMEVSSHALDQKRVDGILFDAAIFTNLTREHLDYHNDLEQYFTAKARIFSNLKKGGIAVFNADDSNTRRINKIVKHEKISYGLKRRADVTAKIKTLDLNGSSFEVVIHGKKAFSAETKLVGEHNISNILAAVSAARALGLDLAAVKKGIEKIQTVPGRLEPVEAGQGFRVFVDYAHTHDALENVLGFLNRLKKKNIITVFGCGGERDTGKRPLMGSVAQKLSDFIIITSDNPRSEDPGKIAGDIKAGLNKKIRNYDVILNREEAIEKALEKAGSDDIVLIAGKGHEKTQIMRDKEIPFNDRKVAEQVLIHLTRNNGRATKRSN